MDRSAAARLDSAPRSVSQAAGDGTQTSDSEGAVRRAAHWRTAAPAFSHRMASARGRAQGAGGAANGTVPGSMKVALTSSSIAMSTAYHRDFDRLYALLKERGPIAFSMRRAQSTGHPKDAVLVSQLVYWTRHGRDVVASQGWIHKTREQWFEETGLSREEQENTRRRLRRLNLTQEWRGGRPARLYFRIQTGTLSTELSHAHRLEQPVHLSLDFMRGNEHAMRALFGPSIAFHRVLAEVTGSVNAALMLSRMIQLQRHTRDTGGQWLSLTASEWARDCGLKRRQFDNAKHKLHQLGLIEEFVSRERHRRVFSRVHPVRLLELLRPIVRR